MLPGYASRIAYIDLTEGNISIEELDEGIARKYLGGNY